MVLVLNCISTGAGFFSINKYATQKTTHQNLQISSNLAKKNMSATRSIAIFHKEIILWDFHQPQRNQSRSKTTEVILENLKDSVSAPEKK